MGICRDTSGMEIDMVKEMAEGLGNTGATLEELIEKTGQARMEVARLKDIYGQGTSGDFRSDHIEKINDSIRKYNSLVMRAQSVLDWLLIQREACGFRTHRNVSSFYPIPQKMRLLKK